MTDNEIYVRLTQAIGALNHVNCCGVQNLMNLGGSIGILDDIAEQLKKRLEELDRKE